MDNRDTMDNIGDYRTHDPIGPKPPVDTLEQLAAQIGDMTAEQLRKFNHRWPDEHYVQACIRGEHGATIQKSRLVELTKIARSKERLQYPDSLNAEGWRKPFLGGSMQADLDAELELGRVLTAKLKFSPEEK